MAEYIEDELSLHLLSGKTGSGLKVRFSLDKHGRIVSKDFATT